MKRYHPNENGQMVQDPDGLWAQIADAEVADLAIEQIRTKAREFHGLAQIARADASKLMMKSEFYETEGYALERMADHIESYIEADSDK